MANLKDIFESTSHNASWRSTKPYFNGSTDCGGGEGFFDKPKTCCAYQCEGGRIHANMTVCIAAVAEDGKKAVLVADKMVTMNGPLPHQIDGSATKIVKFTDDVSVMWAGGVTDITNILETAKSTLGDRRTVGEIADHINQTHFEYLQGIIVRRDIIGRGIASLNDFYTNPALQIDWNTRNMIQNNLASNTLVDSNPAFIVCGKDAQGLYRVYFLGNNPRFIPYLHTSGYATIGDGGTHAAYSFIFDDYVPSMNLEKVKKIASAAKKKAEKCQNVGKGKDEVILE